MGNRIKEVLVEGYKLLMAYLRRSVSNLGIVLHIANFGMLLYLTFLGWLDILSIDPLVILFVGIFLFVLAILLGKLDYEKGSFLKEVEIQFRYNRGFQVLYKSLILWMQEEKPRAITLLENFMGDLISDEVIEAEWKVIEDV
jgi:hypothetical protein